MFSISWALFCIQAWFIDAAVICAQDWLVFGEIHKVCWTFYVVRERFDCLKRSDSFCRAVVGHSTALEYLNLSSCRYLPRGVKKIYRGRGEVHQLLDTLEWRSSNGWHTSSKTSRSKREKRFSTVRISFNMFLFWILEQWTQAVWRYSCSSVFITSDSLY